MSDLNSLHIVSSAHSIREPKIYKTKALDYCRDLINKGERVICVSAPTGYGKSVGINHVLSEYCVQKSTFCVSVIPYRVTVRSLRNFLTEYTGVADRFHYAMRGETSKTSNNKSSKSHVTIMTTGYWIERLLSSIKKIPKYDRYLLFIDEAHDSSKETVLATRLALWLVKQYDNIQVIFSSATLDLSAPNSPIALANPKFIVVNDQECFLTDAIQSGPPKGANVEIILKPSKKLKEFDLIDIDNQNDQPDKSNDIMGEIMRQVEQIVSNTEKGNDKKSDHCHIAIILSSKDKIEKMVLMLESNSIFENCNIYRLHSEIDRELTEEAIYDNSKRKIIVATNIIENSITIPGLHYIIDSCARKIPVIESSGITELVEMSACKCNLIQTAGRVGRIGNEKGICYLMITQEEYDNLLETPASDLERSPLYYYLLKLINAKLNYFEVLSDVKSSNIHRDLKILTDMGIIEQASNEDVENENKLQSYTLTEIGAIASKIQLSLRSSICVADAILKKDYTGLYHVILTACYADMQYDLFYRPGRKPRETIDSYQSRVEEVKEKQEIFAKTDSVRTMLNIWHSSFVDYDETIRNGIYVDKIWELSASLNRIKESLRHLKIKELDMNCDHPACLDQLEEIVKDIKPYLKRGYGDWDCKLGKNSKYFPDKRSVVRAPSDPNTVVTPLSIHKISNNKFIVTKFML